MNIQENIIQTVARHLGVDEDRVHLTSEFKDDLGADSLDRVELMMAFEEDYDIEISDEDSKEIETVKDLITYIETHTKQKV